MWSVNLAATAADPAQWSAYPAEQSAKIEKAHARGSKGCMLSAEYRIDFASMRQIRRDGDSRWRDIRRDAAAAASAGSAINPQADAAPAPMTRSGRRRKADDVADDSAAGVAAVAAAAASSTPASKRARGSPSATKASKGHAVESNAAAASSSASSASPSSVLCADEWLSVFRFLEPASLLRLARTCTRLAAHVATPTAWKDQATLTVDLSKLSSPAAAKGNKKAAAASAAAAVASSSRLRCSSFVPVSISSVLTPAAASALPWLKRVQSIKVDADFDVDTGSLPPAWLASVSTLEVGGAHVPGCDRVERLIQQLPALSTLIIRGWSDQAADARKRAPAAGYDLSARFTHPGVRRLHFGRVGFGSEDRPPHSLLQRCVRLVASFPSLELLSTGTWCERSSAFLPLLIPTLLSRAQPPLVRVADSVSCIMGGFCAYTTSGMDAFIDRYETAAAAATKKDPTSSRPPLSLQLLLLEDDETQSDHVDDVARLVQFHLRPAAAHIRPRILIAPVRTDSFEYREPATRYKMRRDGMEPENNGPGSVDISDYYESQREAEEREKKAAQA